MNKITLITGGARSGKSSYAIRSASGCCNKGFVATATAFDDEMRKRIDKHKKDRGDSFITVEEPLNLAGALNSLHSKVDVVIVDCLTVWLGNLFHRYGAVPGNIKEVDDFLQSLHQHPYDIIIVTNEVGMGIIPYNELARNYRDAAGILNQQVAQLSGEVILMISGIPVIIKK